MYVMFITGGPVTSITGAEFLVNGAPTTWFAVSTANPNANIVLGDLFTAPGSNIAFPAPQAGPTTSNFNSRRGYARPNSQSPTFSHHPCIVI